MTDRLIYCAECPCCGHTVAYRYGNHPTACPECGFDGRR